MESHRRRKRISIYLRPTSFFCKGIWHINNGISFSVTVSVGGYVQGWFPLAGLPWIPPCYAWGVQDPVQPKGWKKIFNNPFKHIYFILWILSPNKVQPLEKKCKSAMSIDVFGERSKRTYHELRSLNALGTLKIFHFVLKCITSVRYFYHCIFHFQRCYPLKT